LALEPTAAFLTHYGRIDASERQADQLRRSIRDLGAIALEHADAPKSERKEKIKAAISAHLLADARAHGCELTETRMRELLAVDLELNAQGLEVWLQRREKRGR
jgi:hypothetical protein